MRVLREFRYINGEALVGGGQIYRRFQQWQDRQQLRENQ